MVILRGIHQLCAGLESRRHATPLSLPSQIVRLEILGQQSEQCLVGLVGKHALERKAEINAGPGRWPWQSPPGSTAWHWPRRRGAPREQIIPAANHERTDGVLGQVVVDAEMTVIKIHQ